MLIWGDFELSLYKYKFKDRVKIYDFEIHAN